jgi:hypothetical protein
VGRFTDGGSSTRSLRLGWNNPLPFLCRVALWAECFFGCAFAAVVTNMAVEGDPRAHEGRPAFIYSACQGNELLFG